MKKTPEELFRIAIILMVVCALVFIFGIVLAVTADAGVRIAGIVLIILSLFGILAAVAILVKSHQDPRE